jgi:hypothetical protein
MSATRRRGLNSTLAPIADIPVFGRQQPASTAKM